MQISTIGYCINPENPASMVIIFREGEKQIIKLIIKLIIHYKISSYTES